MRRSRIEDPIHIGERIRERRLWLEFSIAECAEISGLDDQYWGSIERDEYLPGLQHSLVIARTLGWTLNDLVGPGAIKPRRQIPGKRLTPSQIKDFILAKKLLKEAAPLTYESYFGSDNHAQSFQANRLMASTDLSNSRYGGSPETHPA